MSKFNISSMHPLIPNANEYLLENKFVSVSSEDRDIIKYPNASDFEIELPQDYCNVAAVTLNNWTFPADFKVFSKAKQNIMMTFKIDEPFNPDYLNPLQSVIYDALVEINNREQQDIVAYIQEGKYTYEHMATELTNKMNQAVTDAISPYIQEKDATSYAEFIAMGGYDQFVVMINDVSGRLSFGNRSSGFVITNESSLYLPYFQDNTCLPRAQSYNFWGLPAFLGFDKKNAESTEVDNYQRVFYGDVVPGDKGIWLNSANNGDYQGSKVYYVEAPYIINLLGENFIYVDIPDFNNIDETKPFIVKEKSPFYKTVSSNETNGAVNYAFAKVEFPLFQGFKTYDFVAGSYKVFTPPAERIRKIKIRIRYHNGMLVEFDTRDFSITLDFLLVRPHPNRKMKAIPAMK